MSALRELERKANDADCEVYNLICRLESMHEDCTSRRWTTAAASISKALGHLRNARTPVRMLMSKADRERT